jgi:hypothetical protein
MEPAPGRLHYLLAFGALRPYFACMNSKQRKTLAAVFSDPVSGTIEWSAIEGLLIAVGCRVIEGSGSRVRFECRGLIASFHRPHPEKEAKRYQVRQAREYLIKLKVKP